MFFLVMPLPFNTLLVYRSGFVTLDEADLLRVTLFGDFPSMEIWTASQVTGSSAKQILFPLGDK